MIEVNIQNINQVLSRIKSLPKEAIHQVLIDVADYAVDTLVDESQTYPPHKDVSRAAAYPDAPAGPGWFSPKQRRWFFWALNSNRIRVPYHRTGRLADGWWADVNQTDVTITNQEDYSQFVHGFAFQSRHEKLVGWKTITDIMNSKFSFRSSKFRNAVMNGVQKAIRKLQLG